MKRVLALVAFLTVPLCAQEALYPANLDGADLIIVGTCIVISDSPGSTDGTSAATFRWSAFSKGKDGRPRLCRSLGNGTSSRASASLDGTGVDQSGNAASGCWSGTASDTERT